MWIIPFLFPRQIRRKNFHLWSAAIVKNETNECRYLLLNRSLLMAKKKKRNDFDTNEFQAFEFDVGERNRSSELYNELHRPIRKGKIRGAISWKVKRGWKKGCGNYAYDLRNDSCVQRIQPSPLLPFFPTLLPLPLFFTAHVLIISSRSKPSLSRPKIHVS